MWNLQSVVGTVSRAGFYVCMDEACESNKVYAVCLQLSSIATALELELELEA